MSFSSGNICPQTLQTCCDTYYYFVNIVKLYIYFDEKLNFIASKFCRKVFSRILQTNSCKILNVSWNFHLKLLYKLADFCYFSKILCACKDSTCKFFMQSQLGLSFIYCLSRLDFKLTVTSLVCEDENLHNGSSTTELHYSRSKLFWTWFPEFFFQNLHHKAFEKFRFN